MKRTTRSPLDGSARNYLIEAGITGREAAARMGVQPTVVTRLTRAYGYPSARTVEAFLRAVERPDMANRVSAATAHFRRIGRPEPQSMTLFQYLAAVGDVELCRFVSAVSRGGFPLSRVADPLSSPAADAPPQDHPVTRFVRDACTVVPATADARLADGESTGARSLYTAYRDWAGGPEALAVGEREFFRLAVRVPGVVRVRRGPKQAKAFNLVPSRRP